MKYPNLSVILRAPTRRTSDDYSEELARRLPHEMGTPFAPTNNERLNAIVAKLVASGQLKIHNDVPGTFDDEGEETSPFTIVRFGEIHLPHPGAFSSADMYAHTVAHELGHWVGRPLRRAKWDKGYSFYDMYFSDAYGNEELISEMTAMGLEMTMLGRLAAEASSLYYLRSYLDSSVIASPEDRYEMARKHAEEAVTYLLRLA